jgi:hypothetical protein
LKPWILTPAWKEKKKVTLKKRHQLAGYQWSMPVILATVEVEIGKMKAQGQPGQTVQKIPFPN